MYGNHKLYFTPLQKRIKSDETPIQFKQKLQPPFLYPFFTNVLSVYVLLFFRRCTGKLRSKHVQRCCTINHQHWNGMNHQQRNCKLFTQWIFTNQRSGQWKLPILNLNVSAISTVGFPNTIPGSKIGMGPNRRAFQLALNSYNPEV